MSLDEAARFIELGGAGLIALYVIAALVRLARGAGIDHARSLVAQGAVAGLSLKVAAALLKTLEVHSWSQVGIFALTLALRTLLKRHFMSELSASAARSP